MKKIIIKNIDIIDADVVVCVGVDLKYFDRFFRKCEVSVDFAKGYKTIITEVNRCLERLKSDVALCAEIVASGKEFHFIFLRDWGKTIEDYDNLLHEVVHYKQFVLDCKYSEKEPEFESYFICSVFKNIRRELNNNMPNMDGTGPRGKGKRTGRGLGKCKPIKKKK